MKELTIGRNDAGQRLDRFLAKAVPLMPASLAQKYIRIKRIKLNGKRAERDSRLNEGDVLQLYINDEFFDKPSQDNAYLTVATPKLSIVYEDEHVLLVDKRPGTMVATMFAGCGGSGAASGEASGEASGAKTYNVGVAIYQFDDNFMTLYRNEIEAYFKTLETDTVKYDVTIVDGKNDMATQTDQIKTFITQGMDVIICNLVQTSSAELIIDEVVAANIPLVLINREPLGDNGDESYAGILDNANVCYVGADARQSGTYQGEIVLSLADKGDINGDGKVSYVMIQGDPENPDAQYRTQFSIKALTDAGMEVEELVNQVGMWATDKGQEIAATALSQHGDAVEVIFCNNDGMALGAAAAIEAAGRKVGEDIYLLGVDAFEECQEMVKNGTMTGTVLNDHIGQSHTAVDVAVKALNGEAIENYYWVDYVMIK